MKTKEQVMTYIVFDGSEPEQDFGDKTRFPVKVVYPENASVWTDQKNKEKVKDLLKNKSRILCTVSSGKAKDGSKTFLNFWVTEDKGDESPQSSIYTKLQKWKQFPGTAHYDWLTGYVGLNYEELYDLVLSGNVVPLKSCWFALDDEYVKRGVRRPNSKKLEQNLKDFKEVYYDRVRTS